MKKILFILSILFLPTFCFASELVVDDFESYNVGSLAGQGQWNVQFLTATSSPQATTTEAHTGTKSVGNLTGFNSAMYATTTAGVGNDSFSFWIKPLQTNSRIEIYAGDGTGSDILSGDIVFDVNFHYSTTYGFMSYYDAFSYATTSYASGTWQKVSIIASSTDRTYQKVMLDSYDFGWQKNVNSKSWNDIDTIKIYFYDWLNGIFYVDDIGTDDVIPEAQYIIPTNPINNTTSTTSLVNFTGSFSGYYLDIMRSTASSSSTMPAWLLVDRVYGNSVNFYGSTTYNLYYPLSNDNKWIIYYVAGNGFTQTLYHTIYVNDPNAEMNPYNPTSTIPTYQVSSSTDYYAGSIPDIFGTTTPTIFYTGITSLGATIMKPALDFLSGFANVFSVERATYYATTGGTALLTIWSYAREVDTISELPIFTLLLLMFAVFLAVFVFKGVWYLIKLIK